MAKNLNLRIAVGSAEGPHSGVWRVYSSGNEVYASHRSTGGVEKFSFHSSRICRRAFVEGRPLPTGMDDRVLDRWTRAETPEPPGAVAVLSIFWPTLHLSEYLPKPDKPVRWLPPGPEDGSRVMRLFFTRQPESELRAMVEGPASQLVIYHILPNGEAFAIQSMTAPWEGGTIIVEAGDAQHEDIVLPSAKTYTPKRVVQMTLYERPDEMQCLELTGFKLDAGVAKCVYRDANMMSRKVIARGPMLNGKAL